MHRILIAGTGKIGALIATMLASTNDYDIIIGDLAFDGADVKRILSGDLAEKITTATLDVTNPEQVGELVNQHQPTAVISCLPYYLNEHVATFAKTYGLHYFDLTEDTTVTNLVKELSRDASTAFVPQCGLAPGFIGIAANSIMSRFDEVESVKLRVGALPQHTSNALHYALTWSTEGVINEYGNPCIVIDNGELVQHQPLEGLEHIQIDGLSYEAFNTSGGLGSLAEINQGKVQRMSYKTMRYPGHCEKMRVLMNDLKLNEDRETLKRILENAIPKTYQDVVIVYVAVTGKKGGTYIEENYRHKLYPEIVAGISWSAIQITTAAGMCGVVDIVLADSENYQGLVYQEQIPLESFLRNRFGKYYA